MSEQTTQVIDLEESEKMAAEAKAFHDRMVELEGRASAYLNSLPEREETEDEPIFARLVGRYVQVMDHLSRLGTNLTTAEELGYLSYLAVVLGSNIVNITNETEKSLVTEFVKVIRELTAPLVDILNYEFNLSAIEEYDKMMKEREETRPANEAAA